MFWLFTVAESFLLLRFKSPRPQRRGDSCQASWPSPSLLQGLPQGVGHSCARAPATCLGWVLTISLPSCSPFTDRETAICSSAIY